jgi:Adenylate and Guanylate cyclase catalytic domain
VPASRPIWRLKKETFSAIKKIQSIFITPPANNSAISAQQQPTQYAPSLEALPLAAARSYEHEPSEDMLGLPNGMFERNAGLPPERRIELRVGIHLGDVIEESDGDVTGDGVNIASRLESNAKPGPLPVRGRLYASEVAT